jgi:hypothetical protein
MTPPSTPPRKEPGLLGKRVRRVLRAVGLARRHNAPAAPGRRGLPSLAQARVVVTEIYRLVLKCEPDTHGRDTYSAHLAAGTMSQIDVVRALLESADFGTACTRHETVANALSAAVLGALTRSTDDAAIRAYAAGLEGGLPVADFVREICGSAEFRAALASGSLSTTSGIRRSSSPGANGDTTAVSDVGPMVEELIAARLIGEGAVLGWPNLGGGDRAPMSARQLTSLIRTLDMLADRSARQT